MVTLLTIILFSGLIHGLCSLTGTAGALIGAVFIGFGVPSLFRTLEGQGGSGVKLVVTPAIACLIGSALSLVLGGTGSWLSWLSVPISAVFAFLLVLIWNWGKTDLCFLCKQPVIRGTGVRCPRCGQFVCGQPRCWTRHFRCTRCEEKGVIIFPLRNQNWWASRLGKSLSQGTCDHCLKEAREADLRACGNCQWPLCTSCWDYQNGRCARCGWIIPEPPSELLSFLGTLQRMPGKSAREFRRGVRR